MAYYLRRLAFFGLCACVRLVPAGCGANRNARQPDDLVNFSYGERKVHVTGVDSSGSPVFSIYHGPATQIIGVVRFAHIEERSMSILGELDFVDFALSPRQVVPGHPNSRTIRIHFDKYALENLMMFKEGGSWSITVTAAGELVDVSQR
jgi:hypothetical protein